MRPLKYLFLLIVISVAHPNAARAVQQSAPLVLECVVMVSSFGAMQDDFRPRSVVLPAIKTRAGGAVLVDELEQYQFWAMGYGLQSTAGESRLTSFQLAIREESTGTFSHAASETRSVPGGPLYARVSLVEYHPSSFLEKGELAFECRQEQDA